MSMVTPSFSKTPLSKCFLPRENTKPAFSISSKFEERFQKSPFS